MSSNARLDTVPGEIRATPAWRLFQEGGLATSYISMTEAEAAAMLQRLYGLAGTLTRFATEKDDTFRVDSTCGRRFVFKVANPSEDALELDLQVQALAHIERVSPEVPVPRVIPDLNGERLTEQTDEAGQCRRVRLMSFVEGTPLDIVESTAPERERVGEMLARLRLATAGFSHPADSRVIAWDVKHLLTLEPLLRGVEDAAHRDSLARGLERYAALAPRIAKLRQQVLHNDFSRSNIVVESGRPEFVTGIIDFGDVVRTAVAIDVSTALLNQLPRGGDTRSLGDIFAHGRDLLRGYLRIADLTDEELALIPHLTMARVIARALLTTWRARMFPHNETYILRNTQPGWAQMEWFLDRSVDDISASFQPSRATLSASHIPARSLA